MQYARIAKSVDIVLFFSSCKYKQIEIGTLQSYYSLSTYGKCFNLLMVLHCIKTAGRDRKYS